MTEVLEIYNYLILTWMALMLTIQSYVLWKLLPEIKNVVANTDIGKKLLDPSIWLKSKLPDSAIKNEDIGHSEKISDLPND